MNGQQLSVPGIIVEQEGSRQDTTFNRKTKAGYMVTTDGLLHAKCWGLRVNVFPLPKELIV